MLKDRQTQSLVSGADVTQYMKVNHVSSWLILALVAILFACVVAWLAIGTIRTTATITGVSQNGTLCSYLLPAELFDFQRGQKVEYDGQVIGEIADAEDTVLTKDEVAQRINNEAFYSQLVLHDKNAVMIIDTGQTTFGDSVMQLTVVLAEMRPFDILAG